MLECIKTGMRDLFRSKLRSFLTIGGISIGVLSVVVISSIGEIGKTEINAQMTDMGMDSVVVTADLNNYSGLKDEDLEKIKKIASIENAMPLMNFVTKSIVFDNTEQCMLWGVNEDAGRVIELLPVYGRLINRGDVASKAKVCVIDEKVALSGYKRSNIVGKTIKVVIGGSQEEYTVVGIVKNGVNMLQNMLGGIIPNFIYVPYTTLQIQSSQYFFDEVVVKMKDDLPTENITKSIERYVLYGREVPCQIKVQNLLKQKSQLNGIMDIAAAVLSVIAGISLVVSGLSIMTVMLVCVNERTREIGIKKSIGATNMDIMTEFLMEALLITLIGSAIGVVFGIAGSVAGCILLGLKIVLNLRMILTVIVFSMLIGLVFGVYPAYRAASLRPVDALRFE